MRQTRLLTSLILMVAAAFAGCSKHATEPPPVAGPGVPRLIATEPPARSTLVLYDSQVWGQFDRELDPTTVHAQSVFLKLDGQRVPITVTYDAAARKILISTGTTLVLQRTYTVEFTPAVHSADGVPLAQNVYFQFTTNSLRRVLYDSPVQGALVGPVSILAWGGTQSPVNEVKYEVYAGPDSLQVASRAIAPLQNTVFTRLLPSIAWPRGIRIYWAVTSMNLNTNERMDAPVAWFDVIGSNVTEETILLRARDHGSKHVTSAIQYCSSQDMPCGPSYNGAMHWSLNGLPAHSLVISATVGLTAKTPNAFSVTQPSLYISQNEWLSCTMTAPGPPYPEVNGLLATSTLVDSARVEFTSDRLAAFFEALLANDTYTHGTLIRSNSNIFYHSPLTGEGAKLPYALIRFVRPGPGPAR